MFKTCRYDYQYVSVETVGVLAYEAFTFGDKDQQVSLSLGFGCGALTDGNLLGTSGILGMGSVDGVVAGDTEVLLLSHALCRPQEQPALVRCMG